MHQENNGVEFEESWNTITGKILRIIASSLILWFCGLSLLCIYPTHSGVFVVYVHLCILVCVCLPLPSNQSFYRQITGYRMGMGDYDIHCSPKVKEGHG